MNYIKYTSKIIKEIFKIKVDNTRLLGITLCLILIPKHKSTFKIP